jgi:hypothetical protein
MEREAPENVELFQLMARKIREGALVATHFGEYGAWTTAIRRDRT